MSIFVYPDEKELVYMGRTDERDGAVRFFWPGTSVKLRFRGRSASCIIRSHRYYFNMYLGVVADGKMFRIPVPESSEDVKLTLCEGLDDTVHELIIYKAQAGSNYLEFKGFELDDSAETLDPAPLPSRRIECYGDSVSAGEVSEGVEYTASSDPEGHEGRYDNSWYAYPMITARNLGASINNMAQGGIAIFDNTGYYHSPDYIGMESVYNKTCFIPEAEGGMTEWNFSRYIPHVVIFAVGQNDHHAPDDSVIDISDPVYREKWKSRYKSIITDLRSKYPKALFILTLTVLEHSPCWDSAVDEISRELGDRMVVHYKFRRTGRATPGHPRITEQYEMAEELTAYISSLGDSVWRD